MKPSCIAFAAVLCLGLLPLVSPAATGFKRISRAAAKAEGPKQIEGQLVVAEHGSKLLRTKADVYRTQIDDAAICDLVQVTPRELSVQGKKAGETAITVWLKDGRHRPVRLRVRVIAD